MPNCAHCNGTVTTLRIDPFETLSPSDGEYWFELDNIRLVPAASLTLFAGYDGGSSDIYTVPAYTEIDLSEYGEPQRSGYTFAGRSNPETGEQVTSVSLDSDTVLSALWTKNASIEWTFADGNYHGWRAWGEGCLPMDRWLEQLEAAGYRGELSLLVPGERYVDRPGHPLRQALAALRTGGRT